MQADAQFDRVKDSVCSFVVGGVCEQMLLSQIRCLTFISVRLAAVFHLAPHTILLLAK